MSSNKPDPVRFSRLKLMGKSAAHFAEGYGGETGPMRKGSALHAYLLGGPEKVAVFRDGIRNKKSSKWIDFQAAHVGKHILIPSELAAVEGMRRSIEKHQRAMDLLDDGVQEQTITWEIDGRPCKGTPDVVKAMRDDAIVTELKSCESSKPEFFMKRAERFGYHGQVDWYGLGVERCPQYTARRVRDSYIVAVESSAPYPVTVIHVGERMLSRGRQMWRGWWEQLRVCEESQHFPAYVQNDVEWDESPDEFGLDWGDAAAE
jgi:hypothetical protein